MEGSFHPLEYEVGAVADYYAVLLLGKVGDYPLLCLVEPFVVLEAGFGKGIALFKESFGAVGVELFVVLAHIVFCKVAFFGYQADQFLVIDMDSQGIAQVFPWAAVLLVGIKEALMIFGGAWMLKKGIVVYSNYLGKIATVAFISALVLAFFHEELMTAALPLDQILLWISVVLAFAALALYACRAWKQLKTLKSAPESAGESIPK